MQHESNVSHIARGSEDASVADLDGTAGGHDIYLSVRMIFSHFVIDIVFWLAIGAFFAVAVLTWGWSHWWLIATGYTMAQIIACSAAIVDLVIEVRGMRRIAEKVRSA